MGWQLMPNPGEPDICNETCNHKDCAELREFIEKASCDLCQKAVLPGTAFVFIDARNDVIAHWRCHAEATEKAVPA